MSDRLIKIVRAMKGIQERIDWLEFESPVTLKSFIFVFIFGKDEYDEELERLKKVKRELKEMLLQSKKGDPQ